MELISGGNAQKLGIIRYSLVLAGSHSCVTGDTLETFVVGDLDFLIRKRAIRQGPDQFSMKGRARAACTWYCCPWLLKNSDNFFDT